MQTSFADTILSIAITRNLVHLELGTIPPVESQNGKQKLKATPTQQVAMPLEGFVRALGMHEQVVKKLFDGVLKQHSQPESTVNTGISGTNIPQQSFRPQLRGCPP